MQASARPSTGDIIHVRSRQYLVDDVVSPPNPGDDTLVRLSCLDDDEELEVLWEREIDADVLSGASLMRVADKGFDDPEVFSAPATATCWVLSTVTSHQIGVS